MPKQQVQRAPLPLSHPFFSHRLAPGHAASPEVLPAQAPRSRPTPVARAATHLFSKVRLLLSGPGPRADAQYRHHLKKASRAMASLLDTLVNEPGNVKALDASRHAAASAAKGLKHNLGVSPTRLFEVRANVQLEYLPDGDLQCLATHLAEWSQKGMPPQHESTLQRLRPLVQKEIARRAMFQGFQAALEKLADGAPAVDVGFARALKAADDLIGMLPPNNADPATRRPQLVLELLGRCVDNGSLSEHDACRLLAALPSERQHELASAPRVTEFHDAKAVRMRLDLAIAERQETLTYQAVSALSALRTALAASSDTVALAAAVQALSRQWRALATHCAVHGTPLDGSIASNFAHAKVALASALAQQRLDVAGLTPEQLLGYAAAIDELSVTGDYAVELAASAARLGIKTFPSGTVVFPSADVQRHMAEQPALMLASPFPAYTPQGQTESTGVTEALWKDMPRATYAVNTANILETLIAPDQKIASDSPLLREVLRTMAARLGLNPDQMLATSQVANQGLWTALEAQLRTPQSPVRLADGTPGTLMGRPHDSFTFRRGPQGQLLVRCEHELQEVSAFIDPESDGAMVPLDASRSHAWFCQEYEITPDGQWKASQPLVSSYVLVPAS